MPKTIFVTGGSGFVGSAVIAELVNRGDDVAALAHRGRIDPRGGRVRTVVGDLFDTNALADAMRGSDAVIHLVGIIMEKPSAGITFTRLHVEATRNVVAAAEKSGIARYVHMSALGTRPGAISGYHQTKFAAEQIVRASQLQWTILRPSMIHGPSGEFMKMEAAWARGKSPPFLFMPYFGAGLLGLGGAGRIQPVYVDDVARAFVDALEKPKTVCQTYDLGGPTTMTWQQMHHRVAEVLLGKRRPVVPIPAWYARLLSAVIPAGLLPFNRDQIIMSGEDNTCDMTSFAADFGWMPALFAESLKGYSASL